MTRRVSPAAIQRPSSPPGRRAGTGDDRRARRDLGRGGADRLYLTPGAPPRRRAGRQLDGGGRALGAHGCGPARCAGACRHGAAGRNGNKALLIGSHIDTVIDAGRFDGNLGVVVGILAVETLKARGIALPVRDRAARFRRRGGRALPGDADFVGGRAPAVFDPAGARCDGRIRASSCREALTGLRWRSGAGCGRRPIAARSVLGYLEVHIEQGPVLERAGEPLGVVTAIASQSRPPHSHRRRGRPCRHGADGDARDALTAAAEIILAAGGDRAKGRKRSARRHRRPCRGRAGRLQRRSRPMSHSRSTCSAQSDEARRAAVEEITLFARKIDKRRQVVVGVETVLEAGRPLRAAPDERRSPPASAPSGPSRREPDVGCRP